MVAAAAATPTATAESGVPRASPKVGQILQAARAIFMREGYGAASMDAIAREANVSKATLYAHFSGKEALFAAVIRHRCAQLAWTHLDDETWRSSPADGLRRIGRDFCDLIFTPETLAIYRVVVSEAPRFPELGRVFYDMGAARARQRLADFLAQAARSGALRIPDPLLAAEQFIGMLFGHFHLPRVLGLIERPSDHEIDTVVDLAVGLIMRGYAAD